MGMHTFDDLVVVLDLDDTLYSEADYVLSGMRAVTATINAIYNSELTDELVEAYSTGHPDVWGLACSLLELPEKAKESFLWMYRLHTPEIALSPQVRDWLDALRQANAQFAIVTDGRSVSQRLKLASLGLADVPAYVSEEHDSEKPSPKRFQEIMRRWPGRRYVYIGDNPRKDFIAPNDLGWLTLGLVDKGNNIHPQHANQDERQAPRYWVDTLEDAMPHLCAYVEAKIQTS